MVKRTGVLQTGRREPEEQPDADRSLRRPLPRDPHPRRLGRGTAFRRALAVLAKLGVKRLIGAKFPLARIEGAFAHATAGRGAKTVVVPSA